MTIVVLLLVTSSVNVANLLLARASARHREIGVRLSLGADRWRLIKQSLTESCVLGIMGGAVGLLLAPAVGAFLVRFLSTAVGPVELAYQLDTSVLAFVAATSCVVVLLFGLGPAIAATRLDPSSLFRGITIGRHQGSLRPRSLLVTAQVAIACVLLVGAMLFARSLQALTSLDAGFEPANVLILQARLASATPTGTERVRRYERIAQRLAGVPGVRSTALSSENLFSGNTWTESVRVPNFTPPAGDNAEAVLLVISPGFFTTMNTPLLRGRDFDARETDQSQGVAIVNQAMARYYFGATDVVGRTFRLATSDFADPLTVVGVVDDAKYKSLRESTPRIVYLSDQQVSGPMEGATNIAVRTIGDPEQMQDVLWKEARSADADLRQAGTVTQARLVNATIAQDVMLAQLSGIFGLTAALLTCLGLYGLTAYEVSRRTAEIGLRIALGAQPADIRRAVLRSVLVLIGTGLVVGLGVALGLGRLVESLLFGVRSTDLVTLLLATVLLLCVGAGAAYLPARRAMTLDPMVALRCE
jgi:predicted permease